MLLSEDDLNKFRADGYLLVPNFLSTAECNLLEAEIAKEVDRMDIGAGATRTTFSTGESSKHMYDDYFKTSGDKIRFFFESSAVDEHGSLKYSKEQSLNKVAHALHWLNDGFRKVTFSDKVKAVAKQLQFVNPKVIHSMYIFKSPNIGTEVAPHQDASYLYCEPMDKVVGMWFALEDADVSNGCLNFIPGSNINEPVRRRLIRTIDKEGCLNFMHNGPPVQYEDSKFVPVPAKKGDMILIDARVVHASAANTSDRPRPIYTFHLFDDNEVEFSELNWIQPTPESPFKSLYEN